MSGSRQNGEPSDEMRRWFEKNIFISEIQQKRRLEYIFIFFGRSEEEKWNTNKMDIKMKFLRCFIINWRAHSRKPVFSSFCFRCSFCLLSLMVFGGNVLSLRAPVYTISPQHSPVAQTSILRAQNWSRWSVFAFHTNTKLGWHAMTGSIERRVHKSDMRVSLFPEMWYSNKDQLRKVADMLVASRWLPARLKYDDLIN